MGTYLVVMERALPPQSLRFGLLNFASKHRPAEFVLLQTQHATADDALQDARPAAEANAASARSLLAGMGLSVVDAMVGDSAPSRAIDEAMAAGRTYEGIVLTWKEPVLLRLLHLDIAHRLRRRYGIPVICIDPDTSVAAGRGAVARAGGRR